MHARHIMSSHVTTATPETSVEKCLRIVDRTGFTALPIVDADRHLTGIVSE